MILETKNGVPFYVDEQKMEPEWIRTTEKIIREIWEENVYLLNPGDFSHTGIFLDIGANIGVCSVYASFLSPNVKVYAYEPEPINFSILQENIKLHELENRIIPFRQAVCGACGDVWIVSSGGASFVTETPGPTRKGCGVEAITLEQIFKQNNLIECDVCKIDVEGSEYDIISQSNVETLRKIRYLTLEFSTDTSHKFGKMVEKLAEVFNLQIIGTPTRGGYIYGRRYE